jgi:hypothetical protein
MVQSCRWVPACMHATLVAGWVCCCHHDVTVVSPWTHLVPPIGCSVDGGSSDVQCTHLAVRQVPQFGTLTRRYSGVWRLTYTLAGMHVYAVPVLLEGSCCRTHVHCAGLLQGLLVSAKLHSQVRVSPSPVPTMPISLWATMEPALPAQ